METHTLLVGTRKGLLVLERSASGWSLREEAHAGNPVSYAMRDRRSGNLFAGLDLGHWGPKLQRSKDDGRTWEELKAPAYPPTATIKGKPAALEYLWCIAEGGESRRSRLYVGTNPGGLFRSEDGGDSFALVEPLWNHPSREDHWFGGGRNTPGIHSVVVDPRNEARVLVGISCAGVFESSDDGASWAPRNAGLRADFLPDPAADVGHDPHLLGLCASSPDVLWQQNHCGIFRSVDGGRRWTDVSEPEGPARFGFALAAHAHRPEVAWVVPAISDQKRMAVDRRLQVCRTENGGRSWTSLTRGLPQTLCYDVVYRHALDLQGEALVFGSTTGNLFFSFDGGEHWETVGTSLPPIYSVRFG
ncbi:MAG: WD40/YVTN/BNR-like repeat-containing protein [Myxococcales bacterium]